MHLGFTDVFERTRNADAERLLHSFATAYSEDFSPFRNPISSRSFAIAFQLIVRLWQLVFLSTKRKEQSYHSSSARPICRFCKSTSSRRKACWINCKAPLQYWTPDFRINNSCTTDYEVIDAQRTNHNISRAGTSYLQAQDTGPCSRSSLSSSNTVSCSCF